MNQRGPRAWGWGAGVLAVYLLIGVVYTWPLAQQSGSRVASDPGDPMLNAAVLWWDATVLPFSHGWWSPPYFYPSMDISAFTENLVGLSVLSTPVYWITRSPLAAYNIALLLTWPLSAFAAYLLVHFLTRRRDAAFVAGLAYGFTPYRMEEIGHAQSLASCWLPLIFLGLHGYLEDRRLVWLALFGAAWVVQSLADGYYMLFGAVLITLWLGYFCSRRDRWAALPGMLGAWAVASLPLVPIMLKYRAVHDHYGLRRSLGEVMAFSARLNDWVHTPQWVRFWFPTLADAGQNLFPGLAAVALTAIGLAYAIRQPLAGPTFRSGAAADDTRPRRIGRAILLAVVLLSVVATIVTMIIGPWDASRGVIALKMTDLNRASVLLATCGVAWLLLTPATRSALGRRSPLIFYAFATIAAALFCFGPVIRAGQDVIFDPAPYRWLMLIFPGFDQIRVPPRFWMLGVMSLAIAAGLSFARLPLRPGPPRTIGLTVVAVALMLDGWIRVFPMATPPPPLPAFEAPGRPEAVLEVPIGPDWDAAATYRSIWHRRPVLNGVSGYEPPHYTPLQWGLQDHDPAVLGAIASLGPFDIVINRAEDRDGAWERYASGAPGSARIAFDEGHVTYRIPAGAGPDETIGERLPVSAVRASSEDPAPVLDGNLETEWRLGPQALDQWIVADLGSVRTVGGLLYAVGEFARDFPRRLGIDASTDGVAWETVWEGPTAARAFLAAVRGPREGAMRIAFPSHEARFIRLRPLMAHRNLWRIAELEIHAPAQR